MNVKVTTGGNLHVGLWGAWFQLTVSEARELATLLLEQAAQAEEKALDLAQQAEAAKLARQREQAAPDPLDPERAAVQSLLDTLGM